MLDKSKVVQELERALPTLFKETSDELARAQELFAWLLCNPEALEKVRTAPGPYPVPSWQGGLDETCAVEPHAHPYAVVSVDGSQIYPDKHQGVPCYLINSGCASFVYGEQSSVSLSSSPSIFTQIDDTNISEDMVNCRRAEREFEVGLAQTVQLRAEHPGLPLVFLCDGSLIFWHLESKSQQIKERFLKRYIELLDEFYKERVLIAGYISLPKSKELVSILRNCIELKISPCQDASFDTITDTDILNFFLPLHHRSVLFIHNSQLAASYPKHLRPCFFYLHVKTEIVRVEVPAWIAQDQSAVDTISCILIDQSMKGNGYPVVLSEAHEQAVVKHADREFFFDMLFRVGLTQNHRLQPSQKSLKKRFVSV